MALGFGLALTSYRKAAGGGGSSTDPYFPYVPLLLNTTSTNAQQNNTFLDSSTNNFTITRSGATTQGSFTPYLPNGYWSNYASLNNYLTVPNSTPLELGAGDFTIECWINGGAQAGYGGIVTKGNVTNYGRWTIAMSNSGTTAEFWVNEISLAGPIAASSTLVNDNKWHHIAVVRASNVFTFYVDGIAGTTTTTSSTAISTLNQVVAIGTDFYSSSSRYYDGYISNVRIVKGVAVYTGNFTPPTAPLASTQSSGTNISAITGTATSLLTSQSNRFIDNSTNAVVVTATGTPKVQAFQPFSPAASYSAATYAGSGYLSGSPSYLTLTNSTLLNPGTGDFTFEGWVYYNVLSSGNMWDGYTGGISIGLNPSNQFNASQSNVAYIINDTVAAVAGQWYHIVVARSGTTLSLFKNGVRVATATNSTNFVTTTSNRIGWDSGTSYLNGYISNMRFVKGTAVYDPTLTTLTVPTAPVTAVSGTSLLTNFANAGIYDAAWQNNALTVGDAQVSTTQAQWPTTSMKFDGTGDWLTALDSPGLQLGSGDFTIEGWVYLSATGVAYGLISKGTASTGWSVNVTSGNKLQFSYTSSNLTGATSLSATTWYYFAVVRSGSAAGNLKVYLNGTADATSGGAVTDNFNQTSTLYTGADRVGGSALNGYLQDIRITKGVARTITTPTAAFPTR